MKSLGFFNINDESKATQYNTCFEKIHSGEIFDDRTARVHLGYASASAFQRFKHRFTERVKSYIFLIDTHKLKRKEEEVLHKQLWRDVALGQILSKSGGGKNARAIYHQMYPKVKENEFLDIALVILPVLNTFFSFVMPDKRLYQYYKAELEFVIKQDAKDKLCMEYYCEVSHLHISSDLRGKVDLPDLCLGYYTELSKLFEEDDIQHFRIIAYQIGIFGHQINGTYDKALMLCEEALRFLNKKNKIQHIHRYMVLKDTMTTHLMMNNHDQALNYVSRIEQMGLTYNFNYFSLQGLKFQIYAYEQKYDELYELTHHIVNIPELKQFSFRMEQWKIKEAYVHFLLDLGLVSNELIATKPLKAFRLNRFINQVELHSSDKRGANISIQIIQLLFHLKDKKYNLVLDRLDSLTQYTHRYLRNDETLRSNCFIKMLLKLPEAEYNPIRTKRYVAKYWQRLQSAPRVLSMQSTETELIPYEYLWEIILELIAPEKTN